MSWPVIPLWQLADHYAWRTRLQGPGETADRLYRSHRTVADQPMDRPRPVGYSPAAEGQMTEYHARCSPFWRQSRSNGGAIPLRSALAVALTLLAAASVASGQVDGKSDAQAPPTSPASGGRLEAGGRRRLRNRPGRHRPPREPIERQPYRIVFHFACHPSSRIDAARRPDLLRDWQVMVRRFVGVPWAVSIAPPSSPVLDLDLEGLEKATPPRPPRSRRPSTPDLTTRSGSSTPTGPIPAPASSSPAASTTPRPDGSARSSGGTVDVLADAPRTLLEFTLDLFSPTALITRRGGGQSPAHRPRVRHRPGQPHRQGRLHRHGLPAAAADLRQGWQGRRTDHPMDLPPGRVGGRPGRALRDHFGG